MAHPHYNPDFIYSDFHLSELYKENVGCKRSVVDANMKQAVTFWLQWTVTNNKKNCNDILMMEIDGKVTTHY
jgi:hypothetical protein